MARRATVRYKVLDFLKAFKMIKDGNSPTYEEICEYFGWASPNNAWQHIQALEREQLVIVDKHRRITLPGGRYTPPSKVAAP